MDFATAAGLASTYGTSYYALTERGIFARAKRCSCSVRRAESGLAAVEIGKVLGARVIACASTDEKLAVCREHGADETINYVSEDFARASRLSPAARDSTSFTILSAANIRNRRCVTCTWGGRFLVIGFAAGDIPKVALNLPLIKGCSIVGVWVGAFIRRNPGPASRQCQKLYEWYEAGKIKPHVFATYPLDRAVDALNAVAGRKVAGKVVLRPERSGRIRVVMSAIAGPYVVSFFPRIRFARHRER